MNEILNRLYESFLTDTDIENLFTSTEMNRESQRFLHAFFKNETELEKADKYLGELQYLYQQKAFEAGFYTAVRLFIR